MKRKILIMITVILILAGTLTSLVAYNMLRDFREKALYDRLYSNVSLINETIEIIGKNDSYINYFSLIQKFSGRIEDRITFFDTEGNALADSRNNSIILKKYDFPEVRSASSGYLGTSKHISYDSGKYSFFMATPSVAVGEKNIIVRIEGNLDEVSSFRSIFFSNMLKALLIGICISIVIGMIYVHRVIKPINTLSKATKKVGKGKFQTIELPKSKDEIRHLTEDFNKMINDLEKLEKMRSEFVTNVSHEFRTPLTSIMGFVETIKYSDDISEMEIQKIMSIMEVEIERLNRLINNLLTLSEIENIDMSNENHLISVEQCIHQSKEILKPLAMKKNIKLNYNPSTSNLQIMGNSDRLKECIINITENSIKYSEDNMDIDINSFELDDLSKVIIEIKDNGIGIPEEDLKRITERFYRVNKSRSRNTGGTGLGLSIVKHSIRSMNGEIDIQSKVGQGTKTILKFDCIKKSSYT